MNLYQTTIALLKSFDLHPKKRMGQNFLVDENALNRIINAANLNPSDKVLEIGTGLGVLTEALSDKASHVTSLDSDKDMILISKKVLAKKDNIEFIAKDFLRWDPAGEFNKVVANVPYYITTPIIEKLLELAPHPELIVLTVQKEVAERIAACPPPAGKPGGRGNGAFSIFVQNRAEASIDSVISKNSFFPSPKVDSAILILKPYAQPLYDIDEKIVRAAFSQRRKMIRSSLAKFNIDFNKAGIDSKRRAEALTLGDFEKITKLVVRNS
ncbi:MAG: 16S rRNA (adenine1518-N6/adenine1519-N6)-dimethyltransferase [Candidatus Saganbacteria bacterium]|uniref:Ribosomal RNA small subunit methyltransferase A n=1 Tax=Candidatus Saganbacteria bacterium TaxID=2575572 RepID=A0A833L1M2_UNCSA|nr:MAG: 16S rRNA (adenine1518-N6/adenine1519-N6)-dimethyltransferase [Candidatus Saganbacteria bacterium]